MEIKKEVFGFDIKGQRSINTPNDFSIGTDKDQNITMKVGEASFNEKGELSLPGAPGATFKFWNDIYGSHFQVGEQIYGDNVKSTKVEDFLYTITYNDLDEKYAEEYLSQYRPEQGGCSSFRKSNLFGRNYDWLYDNAVEFVVTVEAAEGRHKSIGIASVNTELSKEIVEKGQYSNAFKLLPFKTMDGINDCGVVCNINVVPSDRGRTTGTNPSKPDMSALRVVRHILDTADTALEGVMDLFDYNIYCANLNNNEFHFMIADATATYVVEFIDNKIHIISDQDDEFDSFPKELPIMTNFFLTDFDGNTITGFETEGGISPEDTTLTAHAAGVERYDIISDAYESIVDESDCSDLLKQIFYTNTYDSLKNPFWYSEYVGVYPEGELTVYKYKDSFTTAVEYGIESFENRDRKVPNTWQTVHSSVYNIADKTLKVICQEGESVHSYSLNTN